MWRINVRLSKAHKRAPRVFRPMKSLPLRPRNQIVRTNLYLDRRTRDQAAETAIRRYGSRCSLSALVNALLARENEEKGGIVNAKLRTRS